MLIDEFKYLSLKLKGLHVKDRPENLKKRLEELNEWIDTDVRSKLSIVNTKSVLNFNGVIMPFSLGDDSEPKMIMKIMPDLGIPFDTKKRAPFRVVLETVNLSELKLLSEN